MAETQQSAEAVAGRKVKDLEYEIRVTEKEVRELEHELRKTEATAEVYLQRIKELLGKLP